MKERPIIPFGEWYKPELAEFLKDKQKFEEMYQLLAHPRYRASDIDETYRTINYWDEQGLLLRKRDVADTWRQFSMIDFIWIKVLQSLKEFGVESDKILELKKHIFAVQDKDGRYTEFAFWVFKAMYYQDTYLVVLPDGRGTFAIVEDIKREQENTDLGWNFLGIDFRFIVIAVMRPDEAREEAYSGKKKSKDKDLRKLDEKEIELLNALSAEDVEAVTAHLKKGKIDRIEWKTVEQNPERLFEILRKKIDESPNQTITLKRQDGKVLFIEQKKSQKLP